MMVKVCGMRDPENIRAVEALGVDLMGFIFYPPSPRFVGDKAPSYLPGCTRVGVFVNEPEDAVLRRCEEFGISTVQLHGKETPEYCTGLRSMGYKVIKAFSVSGKEDIEKAASYEGCCDMFLFDTKCSSVGGSGVSFDWSVLQSYEGNTPFLLSGGIGPESELDSFKHPMLAGYDLNSRFETAPGMKDEDKLKEFIGKLK